MAQWQCMEFAPVDGVPPVPSFSRWWAPHLMMRLAGPGAAAGPGQAVVSTERRELCMGRVLLAIDFAVAAEQ